MHPSVSDDFICQPSGWLDTTCEWHNCMWSIKICDFGDDQGFLMHAGPNHDWNQWTAMWHFQKCHDTPARSHISYYMNEIVIQYAETGQIDHFRKNDIRELIHFRCYIGNIGTDATLIDHFEVIGTLIAWSACSLGGLWLWSIPWLDRLKISCLSVYMVKLYYDHQSRHLWMCDITWKVSPGSFRISRNIGLSSSSGWIMKLKYTKNG